MANKENITKDYTIKAIRDYQTKFDCFSLRLPKGTKEKIKKKCGGRSMNEYIGHLIEEDLKKT